MKGDLVLVASFLLLAGCGPAQNPGSSVGSTRGLHSEAARRDTSQIEHFSFAYPHQPQPGNRIWINVRQTNWVEVYPDGSQSRYRLLGRETIDGQSGIVVVKTAGEAETTWTLNDGSFQAFLPDKDNARRVLYFRNRIDGQWQPWRPLAEVEPIE
ncbi:MAG: hypothetical protein AB9869_24695 [Verrucomicrobiia bacterium]